ncbi:response regulator transcription factor [Hymenobacter setariae]|uniref:Response regulator transcription factor n=1 Tax=Hymenobacter setariae TaxID=2594794 RepID=A0A558BS29_9BACT|nr:LytTR family DNA-binding domain-containing protein [Hymenobacter setariae]TVT39319.1 response regulator transcription factor [Hymenobacter setariae]
MPLRCLLVDDEPPALDVLETYVRAVPTLELAGRCENALQAFQVLQQQPVDVLLLDIQMPQLLGTDFLRSLRHPPPVIFTTAYPQYALEGFELDVVDYLLKPIAFDRFLRAIDKVAGRHAPATGTPNIAPVPLPVESPEAFIYVRTDRRAVKVVLRTIQYVESQKDYVRIVTNTDKPLLVKQSLSSLAELLPADQFLRIHRSFIVGLHHVKSFTTQHLEVAGQELPVGGLYQKEVQRSLGG